MDGTGSDPGDGLKDGHRSRAVTLGVQLNHKSTLVPTPSTIGPSLPLHVGWPLRGEGDQYIVEDGN